MMARTPMTASAGMGPRNTNNPTMKSSANMGNPLMSVGLCVFKSKGKQGFYGVLVGGLEDCVGILR